MHIHQAMPKITYETSQTAETAFLAWVANEIKFVLFFVYRAAHKTYTIVCSDLTNRLQSHSIDAGNAETMIIT